jgi:hypothetical protein
MDQAALDANPKTLEASQVQSMHRKLDGQVKSAVAAMSLSSHANHLFDLFDYRSVWPHVVNDAAMAALSANPGSKEMDPNQAVVLEIAPDQRRLVEIDKLVGQYVGPAVTQGAPQINVTMMVRLTHEEPVAFLKDTVAQWLRDNEKPEGIRDGVPYTISNVQLLNTEISRITVSGDGSTSEATGGSGKKSTGGNSDAGRRNAGGRSDKGRRSSGGGQGRRASGGGGNSGRPPAGNGGNAQSGSSSAPSSGGAGAGLASGGTGGGASGTYGNQDSGKSDPTRSSGSGQSHQGQTQKASGLKGSLDEIAPLPPRPKVYPPGTVISILPITFTLTITETTDETAPADGSQAATGAGGDFS